jgi:hypothetical protein
VSCCHKNALTALEGLVGVLELEDMGLEPPACVGSPVLQVLLLGDTPGELCLLSRVGECGDDVVARSNVFGLPGDVRFGDPRGTGYCCGNNCWRVSIITGDFNTGGDANDNVLLVVLELFSNPVISWVL